MDAEYKKQPGIDPAMVLAVTIMRALEEERPGFAERVRGKLLTSANKMAEGNDVKQQARAPLVVELAESWAFKG